MARERFLIVVLFVQSPVNFRFGPVNTTYIIVNITVRKLFTRWLFHKLYVNDII